MASGDIIDKVESFLKKREGIDKTLKLIRYTSRLLAAVSPPDSERFKALSGFEKSVGLSRKAYRLGKFLQDYNALRKSKTTGLSAVLEVVAYGGDGLYYFVEQFVWLIKAGALTDKDKALESQLSKISAWSEFIGYMSNLWLSCIKLRDIRALELVLLEQVAKDSPAPGKAAAATGSTPAPLAAKGQQQLAKLLAVQSAKRLRIAAMVQDLADSMLALNDIRGGKDKWLGSPILLALAGLVSGVISTHKNWTA